MHLQFHIYVVLLHVFNDILNKNYVQNQHISTEREKTLKTEGTFAIYNRRQNL